MSARRREEPVRLDRIYTRAGDGGKTSLGDGRRVSKADARIEAFGSVDELNAVLGLALARDVSEELVPWLERIQNELFDLGADLCRPGDDFENPRRLRVTDGQVERLEREIDAMNAARRPLDSFVLPGGTLAAAHLHLARTVVRRAERLSVGAAAEGSRAVAYLNRLSDLLWAMARWQEEEPLLARPSAPEEH